MSSQIPIYIISLSSSQERRKAIEEQLTALGLQYAFFDAIDGNQLTVKDDRIYAAIRRRLFFGKDLTPGEIGCLLSHRELYQKMINEKIPVALILEDDAIISDHLQAVLHSLINLNISWDMIRFISSKKIYGKMRRIETLPSQDNYILGRPLGIPGGSYGYLLTLQGAQALNKNLRKTYLTIDALHGEVWRTGLSVFNVIPSPVMHPEFGDSIIGGARFRKSRPTIFWERMLFPITRFSRKIHEFIGKQYLRSTTYALDKIYARRLANKKPTVNK